MENKNKEIKYFDLKNHAAVFIASDLDILNITFKYPFRQKSLCLLHVEPYLKLFFQKQDISFKSTSPKQLKKGLVFTLRLWDLQTFNIS